MVTWTKRSIGLGLMLVALVLCASPAFAGPKWKNLGELTADGQAKEIAVNREISEIAIEIKDGSPLINTVWVREGANKKEYTVAKRMNKGDKHFIKLDGKRMVTGLRISDVARGSYRISVK